MKGIDHPNFKTGEKSRYFKHLPKHLQKDYQEQLNDGQLVSLNENLLIIDKRMGEVFQQLQDQEQVPWEDAVKAYDKAMESGDLGELETLGEILKKGRDADKAYRKGWEEIREMNLERTVVAKAEWTRLKDLESLVMVEDVLSLTRGLMLLVREKVQDKRIVHEINEGLLRMLPAEPNTKG